MKKMLCAILAATFLLGCGAVAASAETAGDYTYTIQNSGAVITGYRGSASSVTVPNTVNGTPVTAIGSDAFRACLTLNSVSLPGSVTVIGSGAFMGCTTLRTVSFGGGITSIGDYAFSGCSSLASVTFPGSLTSIGYAAFEGCNSLINAVIPNSVTAIGDNAFHNCKLVILFANPDSYAKTYANANGLKFVQKSHAWWLSSVPIFIQQITRIFFFGWLWVPWL